MVQGQRGQPHRPDADRIANGRNLIAAPSRESNGAARPPLRALSTSLYPELLFRIDAHTEAARGHGHQARYARREAQIRTDNLKMSKVLSDIHISVILPVLNGAATLEAQLGSLAHQTYRGRWELIIADNGSSDKTREIAEAWRLRLRTMVVLDASGRPGPAAARNAAARVARGDIFAFCDADDVASPRWLEACAAASDQHQFIGGGLDYYSLNPSAPPWKRRALLEPRKTPWGRGSRTAPTWSSRERPSRR